MGDETVQILGKEHQASRFDDPGFTKVFRDEPEQMTATRTGCITRRVGWLNLDEGTADRAKVGASFGCSGRDDQQDLH